MTLRRGFTLIEIIIVIAILGVLAVVVLTVINPEERTAQARDTNRITSVTQLGRSLQSYYTIAADYPSGSTWAQDLVDVAGVTFPTGAEYTAYSETACSTLVQPSVNPTYCYAVDASDGALVYAKSESETHNEDCTSPSSAYFVFSTADGRGGTICVAAEPTPWPAGTQTYVN